MFIKIVTPKKAKSSTVKFKYNEYIAIIGKNILSLGIGKHRTIKVYKSKGIVSKGNSECYVKMGRLDGKRTRIVGTINKVDSGI